ncbi:hypothetical protein P7F60_04890 [Rhizobium sp. YJ-22]|uniref:hypothetical protein n=1 Tax=Rhizobium sp. YJ-22 TaxID=3037556 RepID=UPI002412ABB2|nr:hypothetical protein [Rhizobium sp. YJ-22]MDG3575711.1 hypothetical protein [Rhizobium sp. YJ-22]
MKSPAIYQFRRAELERWVENAIALLDEIDGDPDREDDELEAIDEREPPFSRVLGGFGA